MVVNSFILSHFLCRLSVLLQFDGSQMKTIDSLIHRCLWTGEKARITLQTLIKDKQQGGLRLVDVK